MLSHVSKNNFYDNLLHLIHHVLINKKNIKSKKLNKAIEYYITQMALSHGLSFNALQKLILISGAGIAGLAASLELRAKGFNVIIAEKRKIFDRFNLINLDVDVQRFLKKFGLLDEFEKHVAGRINEHNYFLVEENSTKNLGHSDVSKLQPSNVPFEPKFFNELFKEDGVYSVAIKDLQNFLAQKALEAGVHILGDVETEILSTTKSGGVAKLLVRGFDPFELAPYMLFLAEGAHSSTANQLGMNKTEVKNECTGENWIFGNTEYAGEKTFVISVINTKENNVKIANIIFNAKAGVINIAVTANKHLNPEQIQEQLLQTVSNVLPQDIEPPSAIINSVKKPIHIKNEKRTHYSQGNVFDIGDTAGHSSPLAGMGGTLGLTLVPRAVEQVIKNAEEQPRKVHKQFHRFTDAYVSRWISKSQGIKKHCLSFFKPKSDTTIQQVTNSEKVNVLNNGTVG